MMRIMETLIKGIAMSLGLDILFFSLSPTLVDMHAFSL
jgi:hypothetical protein